MLIVPHPIAKPAPQPAADEVELSIVMPCLNEAETLAACIRKARASLDRLDVAGEIVVADNGSSDGSQALAASLGARVVPVATRGYGAALQAGIAASCGRYVIMGDADDSYDFGAIDGFVARLRQGDDLVMGNRFRGEIKPGAMPPLHRYLGNPVLSAVGRLFFGARVGDFHCGLRGLSKAAWQRMDLQTTGMEYASEMVIKAALLDMRVSELPITLHKDGRSRPPHLRSWRDGWRHLRFMLAYAPNWLFVFPGLALLLVCAALFLWLLPGPRVVLGSQLDVHTLLVAAAGMLVAVQAIAFGLLARVFILTAGLVPDDPQLRALERFASLEGGLLAGAGSLLGGLALLAWAFFGWAAVGFGDLDYAVVMRQVIPAVFLLVLGIQIVFYSFFLSILNLQRKR
jgi:glycosyltransferase involved in cell wall biosynthesis